MTSIRYRFVSHLILWVFLLSAGALRAQLVPGSMDVHWDEGAPNCKGSTQPPIQVHQYEPQTYILRQNLCVSFEGNFLYLLIGSQKGLLIDTGAIADPAETPVAKTVLGLLPVQNGSRLPLLVVHTHGHTDHRDGDAQFASLPDVEVAPFKLNGVKAFFHFDDWPNGLAHIDLGDRMIDVIPSPGHHPAHLVFYDHRTGLLFTGDFFLPGRLLIEDTAADKQSAARVTAFVRTHPVSYVLGAHIEMNRDGVTYSLGSQYHPREHALQLTPDDLMQLPAALNAFNGFYTKHGNFVMMNQWRVLAVEGIAALAILALIGWGLLRLVRRWRKKRRPAATA